MTSGRCWPPVKMRSVVSAIAGVAIAASAVIAALRIARRRAPRAFIASSSSNFRWSGRRARLRESGVDDQIMARNASRVVGREEQHSAGDIVLVEAEFEALLGEEFTLHLRRDPERALARRVDRPRHDRIHSNVARPELARERARETVDRRLGSYIG